MLQRSLKLSGYLGFQFLLTSPSPFVPPENPQSWAMFNDFKEETAHQWRCHASHRRLYCARWWCGRFLGTDAQCFGSSCYLLLRNSSVCPTLSLSVVWSVVLCRVIVVASSSAAVSLRQAGSRLLTSFEAGAKLRWRACRDAEDCPRSEVDPRMGLGKADGEA